MLRLNNVWAGYHKSPVLKSIDLEVKSGETLTLIGLNGSGKTTLLKTILGLINLQKGAILVEGTELKKLSLSTRAKKISLLESQPPINFPMSVEDLLWLGVRRNDPSQRNTLMKEALTAVGLEGFETRNILELSSGETKRALLAHALCGNSQITMLDEPLAHLDWKHQIQLAQSLKDWKAKYKSTFVLAIHELEWAVRLSDRFCVLHQGKILKVGSPEDVLASPEVREVFAFQSRIDENPIDGSKRLTLGHI